MYSIQDPKNKMTIKKNNIKIKSISARHTFIRTKHIFSDWVWLILYIIMDDTNRKISILTVDQISLCLVSTYL